MAGYFIITKRTSIQSYKSSAITPLNKETDSSPDKNFVQSVISDTANLSSGSSGYSTSVLTPVSPSNLVVTTISSSQINMTWTDNSNNEDGFKIERQTEVKTDNSWAKTEYVQIAVVGMEITAYSDVTLLHSSHYKYRVRAYNQSGDSDYSNEVDVYTLPLTPANLTATAYWRELKFSESWKGQVFPLPPGTPTTTTVVPYDGVTLIWDNLSTYYGMITIIERSLDGVNYEYIGGAGSPLNDFTDERVAPGTTYYYRVRAANPGGESENSNVICVTTIPLTITYAILWVHYLYQNNLITDPALYSSLIDNLTNAQDAFATGDTPTAITTLKRVLEQIRSAPLSGSIDYQGRVRLMSYLRDLIFSIKWE